MRSAARISPPRRRRRCVASYSQTNGKNLEQIQKTRERAALHKLVHKSVKRQDFQISKTLIKFHPEEISQKNHGSFAKQRHNTKNNILFSAAVTTLHNNLLETTTCCCKGPLHEQWTSIKEEDHARRKPTTSCQKLELHQNQNQNQTKQKQKSKPNQSKANQTASHDRQRNEHDNIVRREQRLLTIITIQTQRTKTETETKSPLSALVSPQLPKAMTKLRQKRKRAKGGGRKQPGNRHREAKVLSPTKQPWLTFCKERRREGHSVPSS